MIPKEFTVELLGRIDIVDLVKQYVPLKKKGNRELACCPFHHEKTPSFYVSREKQFYYCFGCHASGDAITFVMEYLGMDFVHALEHLAGMTGLTLPKTQTGFVPQKDSSRKQEEKCLYEINQIAAEYFYTMRKEPASAQYLSLRQLSAEVIECYQVGYAPEFNYIEAISHSSSLPVGLDKSGLLSDKHPQQPRFKNRIMFPIRNIQGQVVGFGGRVLNKVLPKYLNSPETLLFNKSECLYGLFEAKSTIRQEKKAVVVEGYMDVLALAQHGIKYAVATLGTATTSAHLQILFRFSSRLYFCFDGDEAGKKAAWKALMQALPLVKEHREIYFAFLPEGQDPDDFVRMKGPQAFEHLLQNAIPLSNYFVNKLLAGRNNNSPEASSSVIEEAKESLSMMQPSSFKSLLIKLLADKLSITSAELQALLGFSTQIQTPIKRQAAYPALENHTSVKNTLFYGNNKKLIYWLLTKPQLASHVRLPDYLEYDDETCCLLVLARTIEAEKRSINNAMQLKELFKESAFFSLLTNILRDTGPNGAELTEFTEENFRIGINKLQDQRVAKELNELGVLINTSGSSPLLEALLSQLTSMKSKAQLD